MAPHRSKHDRSGPVTRPPGAGPRAAWMCALIFVVTAVAYLPALRGGFIWDDAGHVTRPDLQSLHGLERIWFEIGATQQYYPLLHTAFWVEHRLWGDSPFGYHLLNVLLHATAACLLAFVLRRLLDMGSGPPTSHRTFGSESKIEGRARGRPATRGVEWLAALFFALHPVCVESVAWIAEQKNTLSAVFYFWAALAYLRFDGRRRGSAYALATGLFVAALLTKTVTATLPAALLVALWWRRGRLTWRRDVSPLLPWFILGGAAGWVTAWFEKSRIGAEGAAFNLNVLQRILIAGRAIWFYLGKLAWPADLIFIYPRWSVEPAALWQWIFPSGVLVVVVVLWRMSRVKRTPAGRAGLAGFLFFAGTLFPALGFINVYPFIFSFVADHFQYLASVGVFTLAAVGWVTVGAGWPLWLRRLPPALLLAGLGALTWRQAAMYRDQQQLYRTTLARNPDCWLAHNNLAELLGTSGHPAEAIPHLKEALRLHPDFPEAENNLGDDLRLLGRPAEAIPHLERAIRMEPRYATAYKNLGAALLMMGQYTRGIAEFRRALSLQPANPDAHFNLGLALARSGRPDRAVPEFAAAVRLKPDYGDAELNWAIGLTLTNRFVAAVPHFERAVRLEPDSPMVHSTYARALARAGRLDGAIAQYEAALDLDPNDGTVHLGLAMVLRRTGRLEQAAHQLEEARRLGADRPLGP